MPRAVTLITTVYNEERSIGPLLGSLIAQSRQPEEIIIVDAGSTDRTQEIISDYLARGLPAKLIVEPGASRSRGRNLAIEQARGEIIACIDAGCLAKRDWLVFRRRSRSSTIWRAAGDVSIAVAPSTTRSSH